MCLIYNSESATCLNRSLVHGLMGSKKFKNEFEYEDIINYIISDKKLLEKIENTEKKWNDYWDENLSDISLKDI